MREIRFRGWQRELKKWIYGDLIHTDFGLFIFEWSGNFENRVQIESDSIGQFIGLKDKNDIEIYEGDILGFKTINGLVPGWVVEWHNGHASFRPREISRQKPSSYNHTKKYWNSNQIIGNIHENPEML